MRLVTAEAYKAGATSVTPLFSDDASILARYQHGSDAAIDYAPKWLPAAMADAFRSGKAARLRISGDTPGLLADQDPDRIARAARAASAAGKQVQDAITGGGVNWSVIAYVTPGWAARVFPGVPVDQAVENLWELVFAACRVDHPDPAKAWQGHFELLERRRDALDAFNFAALYFDGGGTDLTVGLAKGHKWVGGGERMADGQFYAPNLPTEEVFTMPDRARVDGRAVFTKPAVIAGSIVQGLVVDFDGGKAVKITADKGQDIARRYFTTDAGASRLGEVALVANSSPIAASGTLFLNTLFDENAACHIAFGTAYSINLPAGTDGEAAGMNQSQIHQDCMIGHGEMDVSGIAKDGARVPVMKAGEFVI